MGEKELTTAAASVAREVKFSAEVGLQKFIVTIFFLCCMLFVGLSHSAIPV